MPMNAGKAGIGPMAGAHGGNQKIADPADALCPRRRQPGAHQLDHDVHREAVRQHDRLHAALAA